MQGVHFQGIEIFLNDLSIEKQTSTVYVSTKWSGGACELYHVEIARSMLHAQNLEKSFWAEMVVNAIYTQIYGPTRTLDSIILEEVWSGRWPYIPHICIFRFIMYTMVSNAMQKT